MGAQVSVSYEPPPPLPDGFVLGEQVYFTGSTSRIFEDGDRLEHGKQGEVVGPLSLSHKGKGKGVRVRFPGNKGATNCYLDQVCRKSRRSQPQLPVAQLPCSSPNIPVTIYPVGAQVSHEPPPPLPGGYTAGELVYFTGKSCTFESGDRLEHGQQGEVAGPATGESHKGNGVRVLFPGNKGVTNCWLSQVCRKSRRSQPQLPVAPQLPTLQPNHNDHNVPCGCTGKPRAATAAAGRASLLHGGEYDL